MLVDVAIYTVAVSHGDMRLLVLGGGRFVGYAVAAEAVRRGWRVHVFNRGLSGPDVPGTVPVRGDRRVAADVDRLVAAGPWDAVVDTSGYVPAEVLAVCGYLEPVADLYVLMSTVSVYADWPAEPLSEASKLLWCPPDAGLDSARTWRTGLPGTGIRRRAANGPRRRLLSLGAIGQAAGRLERRYLWRGGDRAHERSAG
jgi:NAD(P)-dependent dehydrogenase (short-subunit alcohol dehydrogenase family)